MRGREAGTRSHVPTRARATHHWLQARREAGLEQLWQDTNVVQKLAISALLLPFAEMAFWEANAPWSERVVCSDAAPGGHGLAYARVPREEVAAWSQHACHKGDYSVLRGLYEHLSFDESNASVMKKAELPLTWSEVARPGFCRHITVEEAAGWGWSCGCAGRRSWVAGCRSLATTPPRSGRLLAGAALRAGGRLNAFLRKACAVEVLGGLHPFRLWVESEKNPVDRPSRRYGNRQKAEARAGTAGRGRRRRARARSSSSCRRCTTAALARDLRRWMELMLAAEGQQTTYSLHTWD